MVTRSYLFPAFFKIPSKVEQSLAITSVALLSKAFLKLFTSTSSHNLEYLLKALDSNRPVITYSNHDSTIDDPGLFGLIPLAYYPKMRYSLGAKEIVFTNPITTRFFKAGRVIGIVRGDGLYQEGMNEAIERLNERKWVHIFPEGKCNLDTRRLLPFRWGVSRLIMESRYPALVIPIYHHGFGEILPVQSWRRGFNLNKKLYVEFGDPIDFEKDDIKEIYRGGDENDKRIRITAFLQKRLQEMKEKHKSR